MLAIDCPGLFSCKWQFDFNPKKCAYLVHGNDTDKKNDVFIGPHKLALSCKEPHLGVVLSSQDKYEQEFLRDRISKCKMMCYCIQSLGSYRVPVNPIVGNKLYKTVVVPKLCYGSEVLDISDVSMESMETFHSQSAKMFQGLPSQTANVGSIITAGYNTCEKMVDIMRIIFLFRVLSLTMNCVYKVCMLRRIVKLVTKNKGQGPV